MRDGAVLISEPLARKTGLGPGDQLPLTTPAGERRFPIAAVYYDYSSETGTVMMDLATFAAAFGSGPPASAALYLALWSGLGWWFWRQSRRQDAMGAVALTRRMQAVAAPGTLLFGITLTLAAFDWLMSLDPHWFSTVFGVYVFAGVAISAFGLATSGTGTNAGVYSTTSWTGAPSPPAEA